MGWHVPTDSDWETLITYLGGGNVAGGKLKEEGTTHWESPNKGATDESGFTALPSGIRWNGEGFWGKGYIISMWSSTDHDGYPLVYVMTFESTYFSFDYHLKQFGCSIRCLKNN